MSLAFRKVEVVSPGDAQGNRMVVRLTTPKGVDIHAIAVPQDWVSRTGPTWTYLLDNDGLTLIDVGAAGSFQALAEGIEQAGIQIGDVKRVIITHGHSDHDGAAAQLVRETGAELWAHDVYARLLPYDPWVVQGPPFSPIQEEMHRIAAANLDGGHTGGYQSKHRRYVQGRQGLKVAHSIRGGDRFGGLTFYHVPGHSPDGICVAFDGLVFTGDHVLPGITPHPTTKISYATEIKRSLPVEYLDGDRFYGLATYLRSLKQMTHLGSGTTVLPAHRLFDESRFNFQTVERAGEVIQHHARRLRRILLKIGSRGAALEDVTRGIFERRKLIAGNLYMALSEVVAHIELLQDTGDLEVAEDRRLRWTGTENYRQFIHELTRP